MERLETFDLAGNYLGDVDRGEFYKEIKDEFEKTGKISRQVKSIRLFLMNSQGRIYLQKRSKLKNENAGLYDKSVGGHVVKGDSLNVTVIKECAEELGFPAAIVEDGEFNTAVHNTDLAVIGIFHKLSEENVFMSKRINADGKMMDQPFISAFYLGYFDGPIRFSDGESSGIETMSLPELLVEIKDNPDKFTEDLKYMVNKFQDKLVAIGK